MKICVIGNVSDRKCGFQNFTLQTAKALTNAGHDVTLFDGTYSLVYARREAGQESFLPPDPESFDVIHVIWHPATLNHYSGATWPKGPVLSVWNGCPAAWCPFNGAMQVKWGVLGREEGHRQIWYPIPDWVTDLPLQNEQFTVGYSGVRNDGRHHLEEACAHYNWQTNFSHTDSWLSQEDEIRRLAKSTVNVCWYGGEHDDRSGSAMVCLASRRPLLCNDVRMMLHIKPYANQHNGIVLAENTIEQLVDNLRQAEEAHYDIPTGEVPGLPAITSPILQDLSWTSAVKVLEAGWAEVRR